MRALGLLAETAAEPVAHLVETLIERAGEMLLAARRLVGEAPELARHFGEPEFELARAPHRLEAFLTPLLLAAPGKERRHDEEKQSKAGAGEQDLAQAEGLAADLEDGLVEGHGAILGDSCLQIQNKNDFGHKDGRFLLSYFTQGDKTMARLLLLIMTVMLTGSVALGAEISGRYVLEKVEQGFLRLDSETGVMALCAPKSGVWECQAIKDAGLDLSQEIGRLKAENEALKVRIAKLEKEGSETKLPSDQEVDRMMDVFGKMFDRFLDFAREMDGKKKDGTSL
jgi:hypothetical protein